MKTNVSDNIQWPTLCAGCTGTEKRQSKDNALWLKYSWVNIKENLNRVIQKVFSHTLRPGQSLGE